MSGNFSSISVLSWKIIYGKWYGSLYFIGKIVVILDMVKIIKYYI
jgi:hypothetical protein